MPFCFLDVLLSERALIHSLHKSVADFCVAGRRCVEGGDSGVAGAVTGVGVDLEAVEEGATR